MQTSVLILVVAMERWKFGWGGYLRPVGVEGGCPGHAAGTTALLCSGQWWSVNKMGKRLTIPYPHGRCFRSIFGP